MVRNSQRAATNGSGRAGRDTSSIRREPVVRTGPILGASIVLTAIARIAGARLVIGLVIAGAVGVGGFFFRDMMSGHVTELRTGDCIDIPAGADYVEQVQHHPCAEPHTAEVLSVQAYPGGAIWPGETALTNYGENMCLDAFATSTGRNAVTDPVFTFGYMLPTSEGWGGGDHDVTCYAVRIDYGPMTGSIRAVR